ncbi:MAG: DNA glycosylase AlkZ-like family protein, partial [Ktedonobacteraceae bacterium]
MSPNRSLSDEHVRLLHLRAQRLAPPPSSAVASVVQIVKGMCGIQAQEASAAALAVRVRSTGLVAADVERARVEERTVIRTWGLRGTL